MRMPSLATLLMALLVAQYAYAKTDQPCISKVTEALPHIAGLVVCRGAHAGGAHLGESDLDGGG
jgi:hypothetical protein